MECLGTRVLQQGKTSPQLRARSRRGEAKTITCGARCGMYAPVYFGLTLVTRALTAPSALPCSHTGPNKAPPAAHSAPCLSRCNFIIDVIFSPPLFPPERSEIVVRPNFCNDGTIASVITSSSPGQLFGCVLYATSEPKSRI
jgi:hypothetical protein